MIRNVASSGQPAANPEPSCPGLTYSVDYLPKPPGPILALSAHLFVGLRRSWGERARRTVLLGLAICAGWSAPSATQAGEARHAIAMHGAPAWPEGFTRLPYANPDAPKGGRLVQGVLGTFDSLNPFIVKGIAPPAIRGYVVESLMARGYDAVSYTHLTLPTICSV